MEFKGLKRGETPVTLRNTSKRVVRKGEEHFYTLQAIKLHMLAYGFYEKS